MEYGIIKTFSYYVSSDYIEIIAVADSPDYLYRWKSYIFGLMA